MRRPDICSRRNIFSLTLISVTIFVILQVVELFVNIHYNAIPRFLHRSVASDKTLDKLIAVNIPLETDTKLEGYSWLQCKCGEERNFNQQQNTSDTRQSTCSKEATAIGLGQRVVAYSLFVSELDAVPFFLDPIVPNLKILRDIYPGWLVRIYTNVPINSYSCSFICGNKNLFWCNIEHIPDLGDLSAVNGRVWRFLPVGDPTVDIFVSRDLDSLPTMRERHAVSEWEKYNKTFHVMRDSQWHRTEILAGLWGAKNLMLDPSVAIKLRTQILEDGKVDKSKSLDQAILRKRLFYPFLKDILAHDSYSCGKFNESVTLPFPTERDGQEFAGHDDHKEEDTLFVGRLEPCPVECRPKYGLDWKYC